MANPFQDQLLKAGLVTRQQVKKVNQQQGKNKKELHAKKVKPVDETQLKIQQAAEEKQKRDRELNQKKQEQARQQAISAEINQLITNNLIARDQSCEIVYNFEHNKKIKRIYVTEDMKKQIIDGRLGIARIEGRYELVPQAIAEKIQKRNEKRVILFSDEEAKSDADDPYANYQIPSDLIW
jgi:uncharacterized protein YaiL (DUF2058 family)